MGDSKDNRPSRPPGNVPGGIKTVPGSPNATPGSPRSTSGSPKPAPTPEGPRTGRVVHDARGNAVWDWMKETGRIAIESTSRLLRKLEMPELKVEETKDEELRLESERDAGGGYDPYASSSNSKHGKR
jgi:hypothetical protein